MGEPDDRDRRPSRSERLSSRSLSRVRRSRSRDRHRRRGSSRSGERQRRERSRERPRHRSRSKERPKRSSCSRERPKRRSRSRSGGRSQYRSRSHERARRVSGGPEPARRPSPGRWQHDRFHATFTSGGRINEEQGGPGSGQPYLGGAQPSARMHGYAAALHMGLDDELDAEPYPWEKEAGEGQPSAILRLSDLPEDAVEQELRQLLQPLSGLADIRVVQGRGHAFLEFESPEAAAAVMCSAWREQTFFGQHRLTFTYAQPRPDAGGAGAAQGDWLCQFCRGVNFARRTECYQCLRERTPGARILGPSAFEAEPSCILRVAGLPPSGDEEALRFLFVPHAPVKDIRLVRDRHTGELKGTAYIQFYSIEDAGKALAACQDARLDGQDAPLRLCYARDRFADAAGPLQYQQQYQQHMASEAAAEAALAYAGWAPQEFGAGGEGEGGGAAGDAVGEEEDPLAAWERQQAAEQAQEVQEAAATADAVEAGGPEAGELPSAGPAQQGAQQAQHGVPAAADASYDPLAAGAELAQQDVQQAQHAGGLAEQRATAEAAGFTFDPASGYMLDPVSGYHYDANTGLYCHPELKQWGTYDFSSGQFVPHDEAIAAAAAAAAAAPGFSSAADSALAVGAAQLYSSRQQGQYERWHQQHAWQQGQAPAREQAAQEEGEQKRPRRGAVIGASAQLDHQGLLVAARAAEEKVMLLRKQAEMAEAKQKKAAQRAAAKQQRLAGGSAPAADKPGGPQAAVPAGGVLSSAAGAGAGPAAAAGGAVHGRIYESSWAASRRQQQQG